LELSLDEILQPMTPPVFGPNVPSVSNVGRTGSRRIGDTQDVWVFGYGSLVVPRDIERTLQREIDLDVDFAPAELRGHRRLWNAGMDNHHDDHTDKHYLLPDGIRPGYAIIFLGLAPSASSAVNGVVFRVSPAELASFDRRERRYERVECTADVTAELPVSGRVYTYLPTTTAQEVAAVGRASGRAAIPEAYHRMVENGFLELGAEAHARFLRTTTDTADPVEPLSVVRPSTSQAKIETVEPSQP
jgi:hypothetical protein